MISEFPWFERQFTLGLPAWMYQNTLERLRGTPARLEELVRSLNTAILTERHDEAWSIQENVGHLWDLEDLWIGRLDDFLAGQEVLRDADLSNNRTHTANHHATTIESLLQSFREQRRSFVAQLDSLKETDIQRAALHPRLRQPMSVTDFIYFVAEHDDHHLAQITRLHQTLSGTSSH